MNKDFRRHLPQQQVRPKLPEKLLQSPSWEFLNRRQPFSLIHPRRSRWLAFRQT